MLKRRDALKRLALGGAASAVSVRAFASPPADNGADSSSRQRSARFVHFTDVHVHPARSAPVGLAQAIRHVHALSDPPDFILNGGDAINDALEVGFDQVDVQWKLWKRAWDDHGSLPVRHCLGNHDVWGWNKAKSKTAGSEPGWGKQVALDQLGLERSYYRFDHGQWRFIVLDSMTHDEETAYRAELDEVQFAWLRNELRETSAEKPIVIVSHIPILTVGGVGFSAELRKNPQATKMLSHGDAFALLQLFRQHPNIKLCLSGHTHLTEQVSFADIAFVNSGAVSGLWWKGNFHHTDEGYNIVDLYDDGTWKSEYMGYGWEITG